MKLFAKFHHLLFALLLVTSGLIQSTAVGANSYFGGNGKITFYSPVTLDSTAQEIYTINPDGTGLMQVTDNSLADANPQWAPSGTKIAFDRYVDGTNQQDLFTQNIASNGSGSGTATVITGANTPAREFDPSWNPDGDTIAYHRCHLDGSNDCDSPYQIYTIAAAGGSPTRVTSIATHADTEPTWRKDGDYVAFTRRNTTSDIYSVQIAQPIAGGGTVIEVDIGTSSSDAIGSPQWSPTSNKVVYTKNGEFWIYNQDTSAKSKLTDTGGTVSAPTWSPDGRYIATGGAGQIRFFDATTGELVHTTVVSAGSTDLVPSAGMIEVDWARADAPPNTVHECTTYVNENCTDFTPAIPAECQQVITSASNGTPSYVDGAHVYSPAQNYVGTDTYIYAYEDEYLNQITCTVNITVLPRPPDSGGGASRANLMYLLVPGALGVITYGLKKRANKQK